ncbi:phospho-sugar mutase [Verrucomicrobiales bacterium]|nr:phospho-sugar mutase [Verrucomicrobiales bacterium]
MSLEKIDAAVAAGDLLETSATNLKTYLSASTSELDGSSVSELVEAGEWGELNDRFFKYVSFGTSGLRGRTIGRITTKAEQGSATGIPPEFPCVGTNAMNYTALSRATQGLVKFLKQWAKENGVTERPKVVFAHDTRHYSRPFAEFCAQIVADLGCDAFLFDSYRPTPELSFAIRHLNAHAGVMHTASHNPPHDNGYKVYWNEGDPIISEIASGIIAGIDTIEGTDIEKSSDPGTVTILDSTIDEAYLTRIEDLLLQPELLGKAKDLKLVFTAIHGTGSVHGPTVLERLGFNYLTVPEQDVPDGDFPTVKSPNPENAEALQMALDLAEKEGADIVMGTDPDCDRLGVAVRDGSGKMTLLTGNQIGSLMAWYRTKVFFDQGIINDTNKDHSVIVKTFVTTPLQEVIADAYGVPTVETLTGFKYIGGKQGKYERSLPDDVRAKYRSMSTAEQRDAHLKDGKFFIFGGEESYGYLGADFIRDKDGNGAVVMFAELAAYAASRELTLVDLMDEVYREYGYFHELTKNVQFDGAAGAEEMKKLVASFQQNPPSEVDGTKVTRVRDFSTGTLKDSEGDIIPAENMLIYDLEDGRTFAVRPSGTEPKMKFYFFGNRRPAQGTHFTDEQLANAKAEVSKSFESLDAWIDADREKRLS